ncbi:small ribosomal subunit protein eS7-like [Glossophaga mutica]
MQVRIIQELEKKFRGKHVVLTSQRRMLPRPTRKSHTKDKQERPRILSLTVLQDSILEDLVFLSETVGKRIRVELDSSWSINIHLCKVQQNYVEHKVETFCIVSKKLTSKSVNFEFLEFQL